jgi:hypothetical protein
MTPLVLVAALLLFSPLAAEAQNTTKKKLKVAVPPFTFESIVIHSGAEGEFNPTGGWLFLEATNGLSKLPGYEIEWMPAYEIMTDLDAVAWGSRALKEKRWDLVVGGPPTGIERPEMQDIVSIPSAMVHVAVLGLKKKRDPNMMQFVTPFAADVWLTLGACVLLGAAVIVALMFAEERSMHKEVRKEEILWSVYESFAALLNHESIESRYISIVMASPLGRVFRLALLFLVLIVTATYTANLAAFLTAPNVVELGPKTMDELKRATVCIRNTILTPYILPFIGTNAPNPLTIAEQADGRLTEEWTRRALEAGECDAIAEINGFAQRRLIDNCETLHMPRAIAFGNHIPLGMMRGETAEEREIARNFTAGLMDWYATEDYTAARRSLESVGLECPPDVAERTSVTVTHLGGVFIVFFAVSFAVFVAAIVKACFFTHEEEERAKREGGSERGGEELRFTVGDLARFLETQKVTPLFLRE